MKKIYLIVLFVIGVFTCTNAQLLQWNTFGNAGTETTEPSVSNDANIAAANQHKEQLQQRQMQIGLVAVGGLILEIQQ